MARLILQPGSPSAREVRLKAGTNSLGRGPANDLTLDDHSVSGSHCHILVENDRAVIKDLGSTNGTYVNRAPVKEASLQHGHTIHLGSLELMFCADGQAPINPAPPSLPPGTVVVAPALPPPRAVAPAGVARAVPAGAPAQAPRYAARASAGQSPPALAETLEVPPPIVTGAGPCKHHPKIAGRQFCTNCQLFFCEACVTTRAGKKYCRQCGAECVPVRVQVQRSGGPKGFFSRFPSAFIYPFRGSGLLVLIVSTIVLALVDYMGGFFWLILLKIAAYGYLFSFMQNIIHATANEEEQMPDLPGFDELFGSAFRFGVTILICFTLPIAFIVLKFFDVFDPPPSALIATMVLGCLYFPMAFLAVAMKDTALAANPLVVIPAILKVPLGYLVTAGVVIGIFALRQFGSAAAGLAAGRGLFHTGHVGDVHVIWRAGHLEPGQHLSADREHAHPRTALRHQQTEVRLVRPLAPGRRSTIMPWLLVNAGSSNAQRLELKPGANSLGRSNLNDLQLDDPSVSSAHCQIVVENGNAVIKDLGSTNGTYLGGVPVQAGALQTGQAVRLGNLELIFQADPPPAPATPLDAGTQFCRFHPKTAARFLCNQCQRFFCELCVNTRGRQKFCRTCGAECLPVRLHIERPPPPKGFYARLPGAFAFPFRGSGVLVLIVGTILLAAAKMGAGMGGVGLRGGMGAGFRGGMSFGWWGLMARVIIVGYLFTYMQGIIHSTALDEKEMPEMPSITNFWDDILLPCLQLIGLSLITFAPAIGVETWIIATGQEAMGVVLFSVLTLGCLYFPMAFLSVAMLDSVAAANPLHVIPSILKVPREYLVVLIALAGVLGIRALGDFVLLLVFPKGLATHSVRKLVEMFSAQAFWSLVSLYLLIVGMRILGLLYLTRKDQLGWYNR